MRVRLDYGIEGLEVELPDERVSVIEPVFRSSVPEPGAALTAALRAPVDRPPLRDLVREGQTVGISICDITRPQPRREMLWALLEEMPHVRSADITIFIATGTHRRNTPSELESMLGSDLLRCCRVVNHDCRDAASLAYVGTTSTGVPIHLNRAWLNADVRITTGVVEPHFFAGFSGGPKMVAPGLAGLDTVLALHDARHIGHPNATWGVTEGNPVHDDVREIAKLVEVHLAVDVTLNREQAITGVYAGELFAEHRDACAAAKRDAMRPVDTPFDVVLTTNSGYPLDQNLYQTVKGLPAAAKVVKPGGTIICAAECRDGLPPNGHYGQVLASASTAEQLLKMITAPGYSRPDQWQAQIQAQVQLKAKVMIKARGLTPEQLRAAHFDPIEDVEAAVAQALRDAGPAPTLCVLPQGPRTIPYVNTPA